MTTLEYRKAGWAESVRKVLRVGDFLLLLANLTFQEKLFRPRDMRKTAFVEFGPGPMRIALVKRLLFGKVFYLDRSDYGIPDQGLRIVNLEDGLNAVDIAVRCCGLPPDANAFFFADHCLEHLPEATLEEFFRSLQGGNFAACFRMPNIDSPVGSRNFQGDPTHRTSFDHKMRQWLQRLGYSVSFWVRWYRFSVLFRLLARRTSAGESAEEIVVTYSALGKRAS